jgi:hypothetical protein
VRLLSVDAEVADFVAANLNSVRTSSERPDARPPGRFIRPQGRNLFRALHTGTDAQFLESARALTLRLVHETPPESMDALLICVRSEAADGARIAGVLHLPDSAAARAADPEELLRAVIGRAENPAELCHAALVSSALPMDRVLCGERVTHRTRYFPDAFDIQLLARPSQATLVFFDEMAACADVVGEWPVARVAELWPTVRPGPARAVLAELGRRIPQLTERMRADLLDRLESAPYPVVVLDPGFPAAETYQPGISDRATA